DRVEPVVPDTQPAVLLRRLPAQQTRLPGLAPRLTADLALAFPLLGVGHALPFEEGTRRRAELVVFIGEDASAHRQPSAGSIVRWSRQAVGATGRQQPPVIGGCAEQHFAGTGPFEVQVRGMFPGEADPAVDLD